MKTVLYSLLFIAVLLAAIGDFDREALQAPPVQASTVGTQQKSKPKAAAVKFDKSVPAQAKRLKIIQEAKRLEVIDKVKVSAGNLLYVYVMGNFDALTFDQKQGFLHTVFTYSYDEEPSMFDSFIVLYDAYSGKERGTYHPRSGLKLK